MEILFLSYVISRSFFSKGLLYLCLLGASVVFFAGFLGGVFVGERETVVTDIGLTLLHFLGAIICIALGAGHLHRTSQEGICYTVLSKPISRIQFVGGGVLSLFTVVSLLVTFFALLLWMMLIFMGGGNLLAIFKALILFIAEILLVAAMVTFFSCLTSPYLSALFTLSFFLSGLWLEDIYTFGFSLSDKSLKIITYFIYYILPDFRCFDVSDKVVHGAFIGWEEVGLVCLYGISYSLFLFMLTSWKFCNKDL